MKAGRFVALLVVVAAAIAASLYAGRRESSPDLSRLMWVADAHQFGPVGYRAPAGAISPDGRWLAYSEGRFLRVRPIDGGPIGELPPGDAQIRTIVWSPDSRQILADGLTTPASWGIYDRVELTRRPLWPDHDPLRARLGESGTVTTTAKVSDLRQPTWSPAGRFIAAVVNGRDGQELWTIAADGSAAQAVRVPHRIAFPAWTPRGTIACIATIDGHPRVTSPCGGDVVKIEPERDIHGPFVFSPDGQTLYVSLANTSVTVGVFARQLCADGGGRRQPAVQGAKLSHSGCDDLRGRRANLAAGHLPERNTVVGSGRAALGNHLRNMAPRRRRCELSGYRAGGGHHCGG